MNTAGNNTDRRFDAMLTDALERKPEIAVPAGFAARMAALAAAEPARKRTPVRVTHYGRNAIYLSILLLTAGLAVMGRLYPVSWMDIRSMATVLEIAFTAELLLLFVFAEVWQTQ